MRLRNSLPPASSELCENEYSGPSSSMLRRSPAPTKLQEVVASAMTVWPPSAS